MKAKRAQKISKKKKREKRREEAGSRKQKVVQEFEIEEGKEDYSKRSPLLRWGAAASIV